MSGGTELDTAVRLILGSGRSGTTWIQDVLADANNMRAIFEPLKVVTKRVPQYEYAYLSENAEADDLKKFLDTVFKGNFQSIWSDYRIIPGQLVPTPKNIYSWSSFKSYVRRVEKFFYNRKRYMPELSNPVILVKFIRANLMAEWLQKNFDTKIIFVMRHPGAVIESQLRLGGESWDPYSRLSYYRNSPAFMSNFEKRYGEYLKKDLSPAQANTLIWCIENQYPVERSTIKNYQIFCYETLLNSPEGEWPKVVRALELANTPDLSELRKPSQQASDAFKEQAGANVKDSKWMKRLTTQENEEIADMLSSLGVDVYQMDDPNPKFTF